eukprot:4870843-Prymnesium_polylepis.1
MALFRCWRKAVPVAAVDASLTQERQASIRDISGGETAHSSPNGTERDSGHMTPAMLAALQSRGAENEFRIKVRRGDGLEHEVLVNPKLTTMQLQEVLAKIVSMPMYSLRLIHARRLLDPNATMEEAE